jgi:hypothetical protein
MSNSKRLHFVVAEVYGSEVFLGFRCDLTDGSKETFHLPLRPASDRYLASLTEFGRALVTRLSAIPGIQGAWVCRNDVRLTLGKAYHWSRDLGATVKGEIADAAKQFDLTATELRKRKLAQPKIFPQEG